MNRLLIALLLAVSFHISGFAEGTGSRVIYLDAVVSPDSLSCTIPFTRIGNLILIAAQADTTHGFFVLDTGTPGLVLNITYFRNYPVTNSTESGGVTGASSIMASQTVVDSLVFGAIRYFHVNADLINLGHIENKKGVKIFGLLGTKLFEDDEMIIDYAAGVIYLHRIGKKEAGTYHSEQLNDASAYTTLPITLEDDKIILYGMIRNKKLKFVVDSGAETNVLDSRLPSRVFDSVTVTRSVRLNGSGSEKVEALYGDLRGLRVGDRDVGVLPVLITNLQSMCDAYNNCIDGMLGFDFLSLHKIGFNFVTRQMYIWR